MNDKDPLNLEALDLETSTKRYRVASILGYGAALTALAMWAWLEYFSPSATGAGRGTSLITFAFMAFPAIFAMMALLINASGIMLIAAIWSVPAALYLADIPGIFKLYVNVPAFYFIAAILMTLNNRDFKHRRDPHDSPPREE